VVIRNIREAGLSLIELMITITILAILVISGVAFTGQWSRQTELDKASMAFKSAISLAKATAIQNEFAKPISYPASILCFDQNTTSLVVHKATATEAASCNSTVVFTYPISQTIEIKNIDSSDFKCYAFNHFGQFSTEITGNCKTNLMLTVNNGSLNESLKFN
jgi:prepilin-type N-terminal cleavage/methylation domain-containing protein